MFGVKNELSKEKGKDGLWKEPNFTEWYDKEMKKQNGNELREKVGPARVNNFRFDDSF
jgi:hypothetical protein